MMNDAAYAADVLDADALDRGNVHEDDGRSATVSGCSAHSGDHF